MWFSALLTCAPVAARSPATQTSGPLLVDMWGKSCLATDCHDKMVAQPLVHPPVSQGDCDVCHVLASGPPSKAGPTPHEFTTTSPSLPSCGQCHKNLLQARKFKHTPFNENCTDCHDPHGGKLRYYLIGKTDDLCLKCHEEVLEGKTYLHGPIAFGMCSVCHTAHDSDLEGLLSRPGERLCLFCHADFVPSPQQTVSIHEPVVKACYDCHDPHGGTMRGFFPTTETELCRSCHLELFEQMRTTTFPHLAMTEQRNCSSCHSAHWASSTALLKRPSLEMCLECHTEPVQTDTGRLIAGVGQQIAEASYLHGPLRQQDCTPCHTAHGNNDPRLMRDAFPRGFYASYSKDAYALCFGCHNPAMLEEDKPFATGFRNGTRNLHWFHVCQEKGRSCRACHHEHASRSPFHIRERVAYGTWEMEIKFRPTAAGGSCQAGCHSERGYDRLHPVAQPTSGEAERGGFGPFLSRILGLPSALRTASGPPVADPRWAHLDPGTMAPDFTLKTLDGQATVTLSTIARPRLVVFVRTRQRFTTATLALCQRLPEHVPELYERLSAILVWVGPRPSSELAAQWHALGKQWLVLHDPREEAARAYRVVVSPTLYLLNSVGRIIHVSSAWQPKLEIELAEALQKNLGGGPSFAPGKSSEKLSPDDRAALDVRLAELMERWGLTQQAGFLYQRSKSLKGQTPSPEQNFPTPSISMPGDNYER